VGPGDIRQIFETQAAETLSLLRTISEEQSRHRYAPEKWSLKQVASHLNDTERVFTFRALWFARGFEAAMPSFDQEVAIAGAGADDRPWADHVDEFRVIRAATVALFRGLAPEMWTRRGVASGNPVTVRALAYVTAGHVAHHVKIVRERYLA
jgi:hypothetical protein